MSRKVVAIGQPEPTQITLVLWDLAGGETFSQMEQAYYRGSAGALLVADLTRPETITLLNTYAITFTEINPEASLVFAFNKLDLVIESAEQRRRAQAVVARWQAPYFFTSALNSEAVQDAFRRLALSIMQP